MSKPSNSWVGVFGIYAVGSFLYFVNSFGKFLDIKKLLYKTLF